MSNIYGKGEKVFQIIIHVILIIFALAAILPLLILVMGSITNESELIQSGYTFFLKILILLLINIYFKKRRKY